MGESVGTAADTADIVDGFLRVALALPGSARRQSGSYTVFQVQGRSFAYLREDEGSAIVRSTLVEQTAMVAENPAAFSRSHTSDSFAWVTVRLAAADPGELSELITEAWRLSAPRALAETFLEPPGG